MLMAGVALMGAAAVFRTPSASAEPTDSGEPDTRVQDRLGELERQYSAIIGARRHILNEN